MTTGGEGALDLARRGWHVLPCVGKRPVLDDWQHRASTDSDAIRGWWQVWPTANAGVVLGRRSGDLVDVDLDCEEAVELADLYLPATDAIFGRKSKPRSHRLYHASGAVHARFADPDNGMLLELRADTFAGSVTQTVFPPGWHPSGEIIAWDSDGPPRVIDADRLRLACGWLAAGCMIMRHVDPWLGRDKDFAHHPTPTMLARVCGGWPGLAPLLYPWIGRSNPNPAEAYRRPISAKSDLAGLIALIPNDLDREAWVKVGLAIYATSVDDREGFNIFYEFSRRSPAHHRKSTVERVWRSFERSPPRTAGVQTLRWMARGHGR
jgi:Bifunctional DNA primase/polymerase, N-terminal/Primase C terminal 2 (PriCT-2)